MKTLLSLPLLLIFSYCHCQDIIEWSADYQMTLADFMSPQTEINDELTSCSIFPGTNVDFSYKMNTYEFIFTKNFNSEARATLNRKAAVLTAPDSLIAAQLVKFGQYAFDLAELYTRKFRKEMYEQKEAFSDPNFFQPIFNKLQEEMNAENARVIKATDLGRNEDLLKYEHQQVLSLIEILADFCKECKPPKKDKG